MQQTPSTTTTGSDLAATLLAEGGFGAVLARAGVGKTALMVQIALGSMLHGEKVLHISLSDPVDKVNLRYQEVHRHLHSGQDAAHVRQAWEELLPRRFIMTFRVEGFSVPTLEERLNDLMVQGIFSPRLLIIDGLPFDSADRQMLVDLKALARSHGLKAWFTVRTHRHEVPGPDGLPAQMQGIEGLFDTILQLQPADNAMHLQVLKGALPQGYSAPLVLDPATQLLRGKA